MSRARKSTTEREPQPSEQGFVRWLPVLIVVAIGAVYANSLDGVFLLDDQRYITDNERIRDLGSLDKVLSHRRPLLDFSLALNYAIHGLRVRGYHVFNVLIHVLAGLTLYGLVRRTLQCCPTHSRFGAAPPLLALTIATLWAVHPLPTQSVNYIIQRSESMMGLFFLLVLYSIIRGVNPSRGLHIDPLSRASTDQVQRAADFSPRGLRNSKVRLGFDAANAKCANEPKHVSRSVHLWYLLAIVSCALGMASKPVMVVAPVVACFYDRAYLAPSWSQVLRRRWYLYVGLALTWGILIPTNVATGILSTHTERATVGFSVQDVTPLDYLFTQPGVILRYLAISIGPTPLCLDYAWPIAQHPGGFVSQGLTIVALLGCTIWIWIRSPSIGFVLLFFFMVLAPTSSFVPIRDLAFEHRMYLPLASVVVLVVMGLYRSLAVLLAVLPSRRIHISGFAATLLVTLVVLLGGRTVRRNRDYRSKLTMWQDVVAHRPNNPRAFGNLAAALDSAGRRSEATLAVRRALELNPDDAYAHANLGEALYDEGKIEQALEHYRRAMQIDPLHPIANRNYGLAMSKMGRLDEAIAAFRRATMGPTHRAEAHFNLCAALFEKGLFDEAMAQCRASLRIDPRRYEAHFNLGLALLNTGEREKAIPHLRQAADVQPNTVRFRVVLARELATVGRVEEAASAYRKVLAIEPGNEEARRELAALGQAIP